MIYLKNSNLEKIKVYKYSEKLRIIGEDKVYKHFEKLKMILDYNFSAHLVITGYEITTTTKKKEKKCRD